MPLFTPRAGRWPLALTLAALATLGACADEPVAPGTTSPVEAKASALAGEWVDVTVTNASGGWDVGSLLWAAGQIGLAGGAIHFDPSLGGATITLTWPVTADGPLYIVGPDKGITISGNDQIAVIDGNDYVSLTNVTVTKGYASWASAIDGASVSLANSTVQGNRGAGSAIRAIYGVSLINSTVSGNTVGAPAIEYRENAQVYIENSTIAYNGPAAGLGVWGGYPTSTLRVVLNNSIIAKNGSPRVNCASTAGFVYEGTNISDDWSCGPVTFFLDPQLMPLADNGGPTVTHAIPHTSPAYNTGVGCWVDVDQRYVPRDAKCDVGAFEFNDFTKVSITIDPAVKVDVATGQALLKGTLTCTRNETFRLALGLHQDQKVNKQVVDVHSASDIPVTCTTTAQPWSAVMVLTDGETYQPGAGRATAYTFQTPDWVAPNEVGSAVKISFTRK